MPTNMTSTDRDRRMLSSLFVLSDVDPFGGGSKTGGIFAALALPCLLFEYASGASGPITSAMSERHRLACENQRFPDFFSITHTSTNGRLCFVPAKFVLRWFGAAWRYNCG
jgi:hypothetical protein